MDQAYSKCRRDEKYIHSFCPKTWREIKHLRKLYFKGLLPSFVTFSLSFQLSCYFMHPSTHRGHWSSRSMGIHPYHEIWHKIDVWSNWTNFWTIITLIDQSFSIHPINLLFQFEVFTYTAFLCFHRVPGPKSRININIESVWDLKTNC
jgi:hypothetical protein